MKRAWVRWLHLLRLDAYTRSALLLAGAFGAYSLGANNIANVVGVFVPSSPSSDSLMVKVTETSVLHIPLLSWTFRKMVCSPAENAE